MAHSYPIWHSVNACHYKSDKSWGGKNNSSDSIYVGSSKENSHKLADISVTRRFSEGKCFFKISIDGVILKEMVFKENKGKAGKFLKTRTKLTRIKSLK